MPPHFQAAAAEEISESLEEQQASLEELAAKVNELQAVVGMTKRKRRFEERADDNIPKDKKKRRR